MAAVGSAGAAAWRRPNRVSRRGEGPDQPDALRRDLKRALFAFAAAAVLVAAWHPWTALTSSPNAATSCAVAIGAASAEVNVTASGTGAAEWCSGEIARAAGAATADTASGAKPVCDFYIGSVHVVVTALRGTDATAFCGSAGAFPDSR